MLRYASDGGDTDRFQLVVREIRSGRTRSAFVPPLTGLDVLDECRRLTGLRLPFGRTAS